MSSDLSWHLLLELKLRRMTGNAFQTFFADVMEARYGDDYVRVKPYGTLGDKGCDGYLSPSGAMFACYGAQNGAAGPVGKLIGKMEDDFAKAYGNFASIMNSWQFAHNIIEGLPVEAQLVKSKLEEAHPDIDFSFFGPPTFRQLFDELEKPTRDNFLGAAAQNRDYQLLQMAEVRTTVEAIMSAVQEPPVSTEDIVPVSPEKLEFNELSEASKYVLRSARVNEGYITSYFLDHHDPLRGEAVAKVFKDKYNDLKAHGLKPDQIFAELYEFVAGSGNVSVTRQVASHSLLSYLFDRCDIFENAAGKGTAT